MNRRGFLKGLGAVLAAGGLGVAIKETAPSKPHIAKPAHRFIDPRYVSKRTIAETIGIIDPSETPLLMALGSGKVTLEHFPNHKFEWLDDTLYPRT